MKHFLVHVTCIYNGMEWGESVLVRGRTAASAQKKVARENWTHGNTIKDGERLGEYQEVGMVREIPEDHFAVLQNYLLEVA